jgi:hypothetical protein
MEFFDAHGATHTGVLRSEANDQRLIDAGFPTGTWTVTGSFLNEGYAIKLRDVVVTFVFDAEGILDGYVVYERGR